jgi:two-component system alkaline phosphatase synthesis response regulator PhoP/two-component system response regulator VicR
MAKILAVDDMEDIVRLVQINLQRKGHEVLTAHDGEEAIGKIRAELPDLVICDVMMPKKDGFAVLKELREEEMTRGIPFILLTVKSQDSDIWEGYETGADAYLTKPFNPKELLETVERVLEEATRAPEE